MSKFARVQVTLNHDSGLAKDAFVNTWHFDGDDSQTWAEDQDDLAARVHTFYTGLAPDLGLTLNGTADIKIYDMSDPVPRVPKYSEHWTGLAVGSTGLPEEVALCLSMEAAPASGVSQRRRRGRVYLGPFSTSGNSTTTGRPRPSDALITATLGRVQALAVGPDPGDFRLSVFSPRTYANNPANLDAAHNDVVKCWIDNAWDIQRRRGAVPTAKTTQTITG